MQTLENCGRSSKVQQNSHVILQFCLWVYTQNIESRDPNRYLYTTFHSSIISSSQKVEATQVSIDKHKGSIRPMECDSDTLTPATAWMDLEDTVLREINQTQRTNTAWIPLTWVPGAVRLRDKKWTVVLGAGGRDGEWVSNGDRGSVWDDEQVLEMVLGVVTQQCECT